MKKLEAEMLESPTWKHRNEDETPKPFYQDDFGGIVSLNLKKSENKGSKKNKPHKMKQVNLFRC